MGSASAIRLTIIGEGERETEGEEIPGILKAFVVQETDRIFFFFSKSFLINKLMFKNYSNYPSHHIYFKIIKIY